MLYYVMSISTVTGTASMPIHFALWMLMSMAFLFAPNLVIPAENLLKKEKNVAKY